MLFVFSVLTGCASIGNFSQSSKNTTHGYPMSERACLERVMYFESNRSSREGMIAVGTIVMNRVNSSAYPDTICGVIGQPNQFAPGVLTRAMTEPRSLERAREAADAVLRGERSSKLKNAMFFHTAGLTFPYRNMHYVQIAGGNAFYEKRNRDGSLQVPVHDSTYDVAYAFRQEGNKASVNAIKAIINESGSDMPVMTADSSYPTQMGGAQSSSMELGYTAPSQERLLEISAFLLNKGRS